MSTAAPIVLGKYDAIRQPDGYRYEPTRGHQTTLRWRGPKPKINAIIPDLIAGGYSYDCSSQNGVVWELAAYTAQPPDGIGGTEEQPINVWESFPNYIEKDILDSPTADGVSEEDKNVVIAGVASPPKNGAAPKREDNTPITGAALSLYRLMRNKVTSLRVNQMVIRHTQIVSSSYVVKTAQTNANRIVSSASIGVPSSFLITLPDSGASTRPAINGAGTEWILGWYKKRPQVQTAANNKLQISQEWEFGEWNVFMYGTLVS